jgi:hypothetical protein
MTLGEVSGNDNLRPSFQAGWRRRVTNAHWLDEHEAAGGTSALTQP